MSKATALAQMRALTYKEAGYWGSKTLLDYWDQAVAKNPQREAVVDSHGKRYTYSQLDHDASCIASFLYETGVRPGDFVSFQLPGWSEFTVLLVACLKANAVINPILPNLRLHELTFILKKCESKVLFMPKTYRQYDYEQLKPDLFKHIPSIKKIVMLDKYQDQSNEAEWQNILSYPLAHFPDHQSSSDALAAVLFTSGTEGNPKGAMHTHNTILASENAFNTRLGLNENDVMLMPAPLAHATGILHGVISPFLIGAKSVLQDRFKAQEALQLIENERCTYSMGSTPFIMDLIEEIDHKTYDISSLRFFLCGGAPIPRPVIEQSLDVGIKLITVYGSTESPPHTSTKPNDPIEKLIFTDGVAFEGTQVRIVNEQHEDVAMGEQGEEASRGPAVFIGYYKEPDLTQQVLDKEGWYYSGDLCTMDRDGYICLTGRKKDIIIRGGENISSKELENILMSNNNIKEAAVVAMPDKRMGEKACAYVVLKDPNLGLTFEEMIKDFATSHVAKYKYPERLEICAELPKTPSGKIKKYLLRKDIAAKIMQETKSDLI